MLFESYIGAQKYRSGLLKRYFAPVKGFFEELLGLFYGKIEPFYFRGARVGACYPCQLLRLCSAGRAAPRHDARGE